MSDPVVAAKKDAGIRAANMVKDGMIVGLDKNRRSPDLRSSYFESDGNACRGVWYSAYHADAASKA